MNSLWGRFARPGQVYGIVDLDAAAAHGVEPLRWADAMLQAGVVCLQLRAKSASASQILDLLRELRSRCRRYGVPLICNDHPRLAAAAACDGVHVGQGDATIGAIRAAHPGLLVGVSTHNPTQWMRAIADAPDYIALGPIFATKSKSKPDPVVGTAELSALRQAFSGPVVAIGGIAGKQRQTQVWRRGAVPAVIGDFLPKPGESLEQAAVRVCGGEGSC